MKVELIALQGQITLIVKSNHDKRVSDKNHLEFLRYKRDFLLSEFYNKSGRSRG